MIEIAYHIYLILMSAAVACCLVRLWRGPTLADRLNAADVCALCCVALIVAHGWHVEEGLWLDIAIVAGIALFVGTAAVSVILDRSDITSSDS